MVTYSYEFQSTPSSRKVTEYIPEVTVANVISIHTFLAEGDIKIKEWAIGTDISIHTFLAEGDDIQLFGSREADVFQSTPSSRKVTFYNSKEWHTLQFQSTPSSRKVTCCTTNATVD